MPSGSTIAVLGAGIFAAAAGAVYLIKTGLQISISPTTDDPEGTVAFTASGGTPTGYYTFSVLDSSGAMIAELPVTGPYVTGSTGTFDSQGNATGTVNLAGATQALQPANYYFEITDVSANPHKSAKASFTVT